MIYHIKTLGQLSLVLKGFRKQKGLTQAAMAERLGITQQSYAHFEANPARTRLERLFMVLRMLDVEIALDQTATVAGKGSVSSAEAGSGKPSLAAKVAGKRTRGTPTIVTVRKDNASPVVKAKRVTAPTGKKESW